MDAKDVYAMDAQQVARWIVGWFEGTKSTIEHGYKVYKLKRSMQDGRPLTLKLILHMDGGRVPETLTLLVEPTEGYRTGYLTSDEGVSGNCNRLEFLRYGVETPLSIRVGSFECDPLSREERAEAGIPNVRNPTPDLAKAMGDHARHIPVYCDGTPEFYHDVLKEVSTVLRGE